MPTIARFENVDIKMQKESGAQHKKPHIHAYYGENSAAFDIETGDLLIGSLPLRETRLVQGWIELHRDELNIEWKTLAEGGAWFTIAGLR